MPTKKDNTIVQFENNKPESLTLSSEPSMIQEKVRDTDWGPKSFYTYFAEGDKVFFASAALHRKLVDYHKGDTVIIQKVNDGGRTTWVVNGSGTSRTSDVQKSLNDTEITIALRYISTQLAEIKELLNGKEESTKEDELPRDEEIDF